MARLFTMNENGGTLVFRFSEVAIKRLDSGEVLVKTSGPIEVSSVDAAGALERRAVKRSEKNGARRERRATRRAAAEPTSTRSRKKARANGAKTARAARAERLAKSKTRTARAEKPSKKTAAKGKAAKSASTARKVTSW